MTLESLCSADRYHIVAVAVLMLLSQSNRYYYHIVVNCTLTSFLHFTWDYFSSFITGGAAAPAAAAGAAAPAAAAKPAAPVEEEVDALDGKLP